MSYSTASIAVHGPTLTLRPPGPGDVEALFALASDPEVTRWFSWGPYTDRSQPEAYVARAAQERAAGTQLDLLIVHREHGPAGITGLGELHERDRRGVVGTWLGRRFWGTGANRESKALVLHLAFEVLGLRRVGAYSNPDNVRSARALRGVGFTHEGRLRAFHRHGDRVHDVDLWSILAGEQPSLPGVVVERP